jgi:hypothetical protein
MSPNLLDTPLCLNWSGLVFFFFLDGLLVTSLSQFLLNSEPYCSVPIFCTVLDISLASVVCINCYITCSSPYCCSLYFCRIMMRYLLWNLTLLCHLSLHGLEWLEHFSESMPCLHRFKDASHRSPNSHTFTNIFPVNESDLGTYWCCIWVF